MRVIGLTGSIACGKSTVSRAVRELGFPVVDGDALSRECTAPGGPALPSIRNVFGDGVFLPDGSLNRKALGSLVFSDEAALDALNRLMAPYLRSLTDRRLSEARQSGAQLCFLEMPLLFEQGYDALCDTVWCVWLPESVQLSRLMERDGLNETEARQRIASVLSSDEKASRSQVVLDNSGPPENMLSQIPGLLENELRQAAPRRRRSAKYDLPPAEDASSSVSPQPAENASSSVFPPPAVSAGAPDEIERPDSFRRKPASRKISWRLPVWLLTALIFCFSVLAVSFTAQCLMKAYLTRRQEQHAAEQQAIDDNYPLLYRDLIEQYAEQYNLRPAYVSAIIWNESSFRPDAVSSVGARGLMQLMPDTAEWIAHKLKVEGYAFERMYDPGYNILFGCWYLNYLSTLFRGNPVAVTCAYHAGQGEVTSWLSNPEYSEDGQTLSLAALPDGPTRRYAERVTRDDGIYQEKYFAPDLSADADAALLLQ